MSGESSFVCRECVDRQCTLMVSDGEYPIHCPPHGPLDNAHFERFDTLTTKLAIADAAIEAVKSMEITELCELVFRGCDAKQAADVKANWRDLIDLCEKLEATS